MGACRETLEGRTFAEGSIALSHLMRGGPKYRVLRGSMSLNSNLRFLAGSFRGLLGSRELDSFRSF